MVHWLALVVDGDGNSKDVEIRKGGTVVKKQSRAAAIIVIFNSITGFPFIVSSERKTTKGIGISSNTAKMKHPDEISLRIVETCASILQGS